LSEQRIFNLLFLPLTSLIAITFLAIQRDQSHFLDKEKRSGCGCRKFKITDRPKGGDSRRYKGSVAQFLLVVLLSKLELQEPIY